MQRSSKKETLRFKIAPLVCKGFGRLVPFVFSPNGTA